MKLLLAMILPVALFATVKEPACSIAGIVATLGIVGGGLVILWMIVDLLSKRRYIRHLDRAIEEAEKALAEKEAKDKDEK
jgi:hypothetical protein